MGLGQPAPMNSALALLLDEQRTAPLPPLTKRDVRLPNLPGIATALVGMRHVGKSHVLYQEMQCLIETGTPRSSILALNLGRLMRACAGTIGRGCYNRR